MKAISINQLQTVIENIKEITASKSVMLSLLNKKNNKWKVKVTDEITGEKIQSFLKRSDSTAEIFKKSGFAFPVDINSFYNKIINTRKYQIAKLSDASANILPQKIVPKVGEALGFKYVAGFPLVSIKNVYGVVIYGLEKMPDEKQLKLFEVNNSQLHLFLENLEKTEKLNNTVNIQKIKLKHASSIQEEKIAERTRKLDNSRSALLYMLKDIEKTSRELESAKQYTDNIIKSMTDTLIVLSSNALITMINQSALDLLGYFEKEILGKPFSIIFGDEELTEDIKVENLVKKLTVSTGERTYLTKDNRRIPVIFSGSAMYDDKNEVKGIVCIASDNTERKKAEKELIIAKEKAEESDRLKSAFLVNMSHEIRTPMNGILGFTELLKQPELTGKKQQEYINIIKKSGERLLNVINDLINISKVEAGQMELHVSETNINEQLDYLNDFFRPEAKEKGLELFVRKPLPNHKALVETDKEKVYAVLTNLIKNAIKFTEVGYVAFGYRTNANGLEFFVEDTGIGIPKEKIDTVFKRFVQVDSGLSRKYEGAGLGLALSKAYAEMLKGNITLDSVTDKGSTFYFQLPIDSLCSEKFGFDEKKEERIKPLLGNKDTTFLLVEDDWISLMYLSTIIEKYCKKLLLVKNGLEAIEACKENKDINLVLMDIKMPLMDGYHAATIIKEIRPDLPIIAQTAFAFDEEKEKYGKVFDDYITKPIVADELRKKINGLGTSVANEKK